MAEGTVWGAIAGWAKAGTGALYDCALWLRGPALQPTRATSSPAVRYQARGKFMLAFRGKGTLVEAGLGFAPWAKANSERIGKIGKIVKL